MPVSEGENTLLMRGTLTSIVSLRWRVAHMRGGGWWWWGSAEGDNEVVRVEKKTAAHCTVRRMRTREGDREKG